jgi:hypothetical protein
VLATAACAATEPGDGGDGGATGADGGIGVTHPAGANELVLRIQQEGGFVPIDYTIAAVPGFSLFGDGTTITTGPQIEIFPGPALPNLIATPLTDDGVQVLLQAAIDAGLGKDADHIDLGNMAITDMPTTVFTLVIDGETHVSSVYALGAVTERPDGMTDDEWAARRALETFAGQVGDLRAWLPAGSVGEDAPYVPAAMRIVVGPYTPDPQLEQPEIAWPLDVDLATIGRPAGFDDRRCAVIDGADMKALWSLAQQANQLTPWTSGDASYSIVFRPLLPDESGC